MTDILIVGDWYIPSQTLMRSIKAHLSDFETNIQAFDVILEDGLGHAESTSEIEARIIDRVGATELLVVDMAPVGSNVIEAAKKLRAIACARAGPLNVDLELASRRGIPVLHAPTRTTEAVVDMTFGLMLSVARKIHQSASAFSQGVVMEQEECLGPELSGKTLGIIGFGHVGSRVAEVAEAWGMNILFYDPYVSPPKNTTRTRARPVQLETLLRESDFVTIHVRLSPENYYMIRDKEISMMKPTSYLINTSRGALVDERALYHALVNRKIAGAALDVLERDREPNNPLVRLNNVTATPHIGAASVDIPHKTAEILAKDMARFLKGEKPLYVARPEVYAYERSLVAKGLLRD